MTAPTQTQLDLGPLPADDAERTIEEQFRAFHAANPHVYDELVRLARDLKQRGQERIGIGMLWEVLRWNRLRTTDSGSDFRLNNNYRSRMARLVMMNEPDLAGVFETRELRAS